jgi:ketosteroid isomerase-like protein
MDHDVREATAQLASALARGDAAAAAALYADGGRLLAPTAELIEGRAEIEAYWRAGIAVGLSRLVLAADEIELDGSEALEIGRYELVVGDGADTGKYLALHRRQRDGTWRRAVEVFNPDVPVAARPHPKEEQ